MYTPFSRIWNKKLAWILIIVGVLMLPDVIAPTPFMDLLINVPLAFVLADLLLISYLEAFVMTYIIAFGLVFAGLLIFPYNTGNLVRGRFHASIRFMVSHPFIVILSVIGLVLVYFIGQFLYDSVWQFARDFLTTQGLV